MCVAFHPEHPALVAGGTFNGEVRIWNTSLEGDPLTASSGLSDLGHKEPIAEVGAGYLSSAQCWNDDYL